MASTGGKITIPSLEGIVPLEDINDPKDVDVLCGRGGSSQRHVGTQQFRTLVNLNKGLYVTCLKSEKLRISRSIVAAIREQKGRFLERDGEHGKWFDIGDKKAIEKTSQALRENQPKLRKKIMETGISPAVSSSSGPPIPVSASTTTMRTQQAMMERSRSLPPSTSMPHGSHGSPSATAAVAAGIPSYAMDGVNGMNHPNANMAHYQMLQQQQQQQQQLQHQQMMMERAYLYENQMRQQPQLNNGNNNATSMPNDHMAAAMMGMMGPPQRMASGGGGGGGGNGGDMNDLLLMQQRLSITSNALSNNTSDQQQQQQQRQHQAGHHNMHYNNRTSLAGGAIDVDALNRRRSISGRKTTFNDSGLSESTLHTRNTQALGNSAAAAGAAAAATGSIGEMSPLPLSRGSGEKGSPTTTETRSSGDTVSSDILSATNSNGTPPFSQHHQHQQHQQQRFDRRRLFARMKVSRPPSGRMAMMDGTATVGSVSSRSIGTGEWMPDIHMVDSQFSLLSNMSTGGATMGSASNNNNKKSGGGGDTATAANGNRRDDYNMNMGGGGGGGGFGSRRSLMSGLSKISDSSDVNSIFSDLSKKIGNVSTRSIAMSEFSNIDEFSRMTTTTDTFSLAS